MSASDGYWYAVSRKAGVRGRRCGPPALLTRDEVNGDTALTAYADRMYKAGLSWKWKPKP